MERKYFDRNSLRFHPISQRKDEVPYERISTPIDKEAPVLTEEATAVIQKTADDILNAKAKGASRMLTFGTHFLENGLAPLAGAFINRGWITHLATTGTSLVDDWEFASRGAAGESGLTGQIDGSYGMWEETSLHLSLAILTGVWRGCGLGESVAEAIVRETITLPERDELRASIQDTSNPQTVSAAANLLEVMDKLNLMPGEIALPFPHKDRSLLYLSAIKGIPFTVHPQFGLDVPFMHPACSFSSVGLGAERDFLGFVENVKNLEDGVYISIGSSVASPMIFEKALSMSQNVLIREGRRMTRHKIVVVDLAESRWDWMHDGEPPENRAEYYLRYCKSFSRAAASSMHYVSADNRDFMLNLYKALDERDSA
ncbi:MAG: hypothetical protein K5651_04665 [Bacteroidales bacterium]|nr:hypothetical protein [Bacteroidales bacterium]